MTTEAKCPFAHASLNSAVSGGVQTNADWWPNQLKLNILHPHTGKAA